MPLEKLAPSAETKGRFGATRKEVRKGPPKRMGMFCGTEHTKPSRPRRLKEAINPDKQGRIDGTKLFTNICLRALHGKTDRRYSGLPFIKMAVLLKKYIVSVYEHRDVLEPPAPKGPLESQVVLQTEQGERQVRPHHLTGGRFEGLVYIKEPAITSVIEDGTKEVQSTLLNEIRHEHRRRQKFLKDYLCYLDG
jgi:hypothetical protein